MNKARIITYTSGFNFKSTKNITKADFVLMSKIISTNLNNLYNTESDYEVIPEAISEGGFKFIKFTNKTEPMYKSFRIHILNQNYSYASVHESTVLTDWVNDDTVIIHPKMKGSTFIKAFDDAPRWTKEELTIFKECFQTFGAICNKFPKL